MYQFRSFFVYVLLITLLVSCSPFQGNCYSPNPVGISKAAAYAGDDQMPFRFPLDVENDSIGDVTTNFCACGKATKTRFECHAAEDYAKPAGTPVYAMADGEVTFSGPMGGYGWLVIIDHPQANLYSLYGHLSPSRWQVEEGMVAKGDLIGYLGDPDENGGSAENPLRPHLHFGIRTGLRSDYPSNGEWRWMGGWIQPCPSDMGWLQPSAIISSQVIPDGGYVKPSGNFLAIWRIELLFTTLYAFGGIGSFVYARRKNKPIVYLLSGAVFLLAGWIFLKDGWKMSYALLVMAGLFLGIGVYEHLFKSKWFSR